MIALALRVNDQWEGAGVAVLLICLWSPVALLAGHVGLAVDRFGTGRSRSGRRCSKR